MAHAPKGGLLTSADLIGTESLLRCHIEAKSRSNLTKLQSASQQVLAV
jgi:hypothetical protein